MFNVERDERDYSEPHEIKPERFLKNRKLDNSGRDLMEDSVGGVIHGSGSRDM